MRIALAQIDTIVGDVSGNTEKILSYVGKAKERGANLVIFPEMAILGYPPRDLLERPFLIDANLDALKQIARSAVGVAVIVGFVDKNKGEGRSLFNAAALLEGGEISSVHYKSLLPTYDVFDEDRYFEPAAGNAPVRIDLPAPITQGDRQRYSLRFGITICEDIWTDEICGPRPVRNALYGELVMQTNVKPSNMGISNGARRMYHKDPVGDLAKKRMDVLVNISASPYHMGKDKLRRELIKNQATKYGVPVLLCNQVGGNDELVFDGNSMAVAPDGAILAHAKSFEEDLAIVDLTNRTYETYTGLSDLEAVYRALVLGTRDYAHKCGFKRAVIGLSGGIDSAITACIAKDALGAENVLGVAMPSEFTSKVSLDDAEALAKNLGIDYQVVSIQNIFGSYLGEFAKMFEGKPRDTTEENIQARIRGNILMAISNKLGHLVLSTGNKSEVSTGYCTLYGDMAGGLAVISDVPKTLIYKLSREVVNKSREVIPQSTITKAPTAELKHNQKDSDALPEYDVLDPILKAYIEEHKSLDEIIAMGFDKKMVSDVLKRIELNEYKRRQAAPGLKVTSKAFGIGRRIPIAHKS